MQEYIDQTYEVPISFPSDPLQTRILNTHARIMVFGSRKPGRCLELAGALGNYGQHWKVAGRSASGELRRSGIVGTAFSDVRVGKG